MFVIFIFIIGTTTATLTTTTTTTTTTTATVTTTTTITTTTVTPKTTTKTTTSDETTTANTTLVIEMTTPEIIKSLDDIAEVKLGSANLEETTTHRITPTQVFKPYPAINKPKFSHDKKQAEGLVIIQPAKVAFIKDVINQGVR